MKFSAIFAIVLALSLLPAAYSQEFPSKIRGYKVYDAKIRVTNSRDKTGPTDTTEALIKLTDPQIADIALSGITMEIGAEVTAGRQSGKVDFVTFNDFRVNGIEVQVEEYKHPFSFKKGESVKLPKPARVAISITNLPKAAYKEFSQSKTYLDVTGTVFVFGKFKKYGLYFKRVVPIKIDMKIANPLKSQV